MSVRGEKGQGGSLEAARGEKEDGREKSQEGKEEGRVGNRVKRRYGG